MNRVLHIFLICLCFTDGEESERPEDMTVADQVGDEDDPSFEEQERQEEEEEGFTYAENFDDSKEHMEDGSEQAEFNDEESQYKNDANENDFADEESRDLNDTAQGEEVQQSEEKNEHQEKVDTLASADNNDQEADAPETTRKNDDAPASASNIEDAIDFMVDEDDNMLDEEMIYEDGTTIRNGQVCCSFFFL